jgi:hypothetical protein
MSVIGELRVSLDAVGVEQQVLLFLFLTSYPLALGQLLGHRGKRLARVALLLSVAGFAALTDPWIHGLLLVVMFVAGMGVFIVSVYLVDMLPRLASTRFGPQTQRRVQSHLSGHELVGEAVAETVRGREGTRAPMPLPGPAGTH